MISIAVEEDESYSVGNFIAHNCTSIGEALAAGCRVVARPVDALYEVWGPAVRWVDADVADDRFRDRFKDAGHRRADDGVVAGDGRVRRNSPKTFLDARLGAREPGRDDQPAAAGQREQEVGSDHVEEACSEPVLHRW